MLIQVHGLASLNGSRLDDETKLWKRFFTVEFFLDTSAFNCVKRANRLLDFELSDTVGVEQLKSQINGFYTGLKIIETDASCGLTTRAIRRDVEATLGAIKKNSLTQQTSKHFHVLEFFKSVVATKYREYQGRRSVHEFKFTRSE